ncbi:hypothetical protein U91I_02068 [alpha proteobacterium U9-1i]|nr:hypothetical protein U91I_02068 [alpha proteobacterium U9-1i]
MTFRTALLAAALFAAPTIAASAPDPFFVEISAATEPRAEGDVLEVAAATGQFTTFLRAVEAAGMQETLRGEGPFTVFAPTDAAFRAMDQRQLARLMDPRRHDDLIAFVSYHVVAERVTTETAEGANVREESTSGDYVQVDGRDGLRVNDELVVMQDVSASNGVIQGINTVLSPPVLVAGRAGNAGR